MTSKYLTPSTIALLALIAMYCDDYVSPPGRVPVLGFISRQLLPVRVKKRKTVIGDQKSINATIDDFHKVLNQYKKDDCSHTLWAEFCHILWKISSLDFVFDFFKSLPALFDSRDKRSASDEQTVLTSTSLWGTFVRRCVVEFEGLAFQDAVRLWQNYERFRDPTSSQSRSTPVNQRMDATTFITELDMRLSHSISAVFNRDLSSDKVTSAMISSNDMERLLTFQIEQLQSHGNRVPDAIRERLDTLASAMPENISLAHYSSFLDAWSAGDYQSSLEFLHRYYDYAMHNKDRSQYQYALLNMAILQADFGSYAEAIAAMHETIATARENKDMLCLNFSLSWLYHFRLVHRQAVSNACDQTLLGSDTTLLSFLKAKALESNMWSLVSSTLLNQARFGLSQGARPKLALEKICESSHLNLKHYMADWVRSVFSAVINLARLRHMCQHELRSEEVVNARCRLAHKLVRSGDYIGARKILDAVNPELRRSLHLHQTWSYGIAHINLKRALHHNDLDEAEHILDILNSSPKSDPEFRFQTILLRLEYLQRRKDYAAAFDLLESLFESDASAPLGKKITNVQHRIDLLSAKALLFGKCGKPQKGLSLALRASVAGLEARIIPSLWQAIAVLGGVMVSIGEAEAAAQVLESCIWQATESEDTELMALLQSTYADASIAIAGKHRDSPQQARAAMQDALNWAKRAYESYASLEDILGRREMAAKAGVVLKIIRDVKGAEQQMALYHELGENKFTT